MNDTTKRFLARCREYGISKVAICVSWKAIPESMDWPGVALNSVYAKEEFDGWPAIWRVCDAEKIGGSCGNHRQHSLKHNHGLEPGKYQFKNGQWRVVK